jgi:hypothetical protein
MNKNKEIIKLAEQIIEETETTKPSAKKIVYMAYRLAKLVDDKSMTDWLKLEKFGYGNKEPDLTYMRQTGRTYNPTTKIGLWGSISVQEDEIARKIIEIDHLKSFKPSGQWANVQFSGYQQQISTKLSSLAVYRRICSSVISYVQEFATNIFYTYSFQESAVSIIDQEREKAMKKLFSRFPNLSDYFEVINEGVKSNNEKNWSASALQCRNILTYLSDELWKVKEKNYKCRDGDLIETVNEKNKLIAYIDSKIFGSRTNKSKALRLFKTVHEIFTIGGKSKRKIDRVEFITIVSQTYIFLVDLTNSTDLLPVE